MDRGSTDVEATPRYATLDAWRGIACLAVVAFHAVGRYVDASHDGPLFAPLRLIDAGAWVGVPLFFTISGYCIAAAARATREAGRPASDFFRRRFLRIYPPSWFALAFTLLLAVLGHALFAAGIWNGFWDRLDIGWHWLSNALLVEESLRLVGIEPASANAPAWSLCYEVQFYAFMGVFFLATSASRRAKALVVASGATIAIAALFGPGRVGFLSDVWPLFALGIWVHERPPESDPRGKNLWDLFAIGTVLAVLATYRIHAGRFGQEAKTVAICAAFAVLLRALRARDAALLRHGAVRAAAWVGVRSYSIYLIHYPVVNSIGDWIEPYGFTRGWRLYPAALSMGAVAFGLGCVFHATVERRFLPRPRSASPNCEIGVR